MYTVKLLKEAELAVAEACEWYEKQQKGLGKRLSKEVDQIYPGYSQRSK